jgi:hypothetical protein
MLENARIRNVLGLSPKPTVLSPYLREAKPITFALKGQNFAAKRVFVREALFTKLGINPQYFRPNLKIYLLDQANYIRFCRACGLEQNAGGFYPLARNGEQEAVILGQRASLPVPSRVIILPENFEEKALRHEISHDVFLGGGLPEGKRNAFIKNLFIWAHRAAQDPALKEEARFYQEIAARCAQKCRIKLTGEDLAKIFETLLPCSLSGNVLLMPENFSRAPLTHQNWDNSPRKSAFSSNKLNWRLKDFLERDSSAGTRFRS